MNRKTKRNTELALSIQQMQLIRNGQAPRRSISNFLDELKKEIKEDEKAFFRDG